MTVGAIVAAAGRGERLGAPQPKSLVPVAGAPLVVHAVRALAEAHVDVVVVVAPAGVVDEMRRVVAAADAVFAADVVVVEGGVTRTDSVRRGLAALPPDVDVVLVHDAARGLMPSDVIGAVVAAVVDGADAVVPVLPVADTVKQVDAAGDVVRTVDRTALRAVQTPQGFRRAVLEDAHARATDEATDDASLVELAGGRVSTVPGSAYGLKVTTAFDLAVAEALVRERVDR